MKVNILIRCSYKIIPLSVSYLGSLLKLDKLPFPYKFVNSDNLNYFGKIPDITYFNSTDDYNNFIEKNTSFNLKETTIKYCERDVEIIFIVLSNLIPLIIKHSNNNKIIKNSFSFSSISYKIYSAKFDLFNITKFKISLFNSEYVRNAYYGGRCEVFGNPKNNELTHYFDYKGMYAQCMEEKFPYGDVFLKNKNLSLTNLGFHTIKFKCNSAIPFLPIKSNKLIFPNGVLLGTY
jgi:hypothetical protein